METADGASVVGDVTTPTVGSVWADAENRELRVLAVTVGEPLGREVVGEIRHAQFGRRAQFSPWAPYSTTLRAFGRTWRDKEPTWKGQT